MRPIVWLPHKLVVLNNRLKRHVFADCLTALLILIPGGEIRPGFSFSIDGSGYRAVAEPERLIIFKDPRATSNCCPLKHIMLKF